MTSECEQTRRYLLAYLGHDLNQWEGERINLHLQHCSSCLNAYLQWRDKVDVIRCELRNWVNEDHLPEGWSEELRERFLASVKQGKRKVIADENSSLKGLPKPGWQKKLRFVLLYSFFLIFLVLVALLLSWLMIRLPVLGSWVKNLLV